MLPVVWSWLPLTAKCLSSASAGSRRYHGKSFQIVACDNNQPYSSTYSCCAYLRSYVAACQALLHLRRHCRVTLSVNDD